MMILTMLVAMVLGILGPALAALLFSLVLITAVGGGTKMRRGKIHR